MVSLAKGEMPLLSFNNVVVGFNQRTLQLNVIKFGAKSVSLLCCCRLSPNYSHVLCCGGSPLWLCERWGLRAWRVQASGCLHVNPDCRREASGERPSLLGAAPYCFSVCCDHLLFERMLPLPCVVFHSKALLGSNYGDTGSCCS